MFTICINVDISMELTATLKNELESIYNSLLNDERVLQMKSIPMHKGSNCYIHSFKVAKRAIKVALKYKKELKLKALLYASILHDYYLYDWRVDKSKRSKHLYTHAELAVKQAKRDFEISDEIAEIMISHMWPVDLKYYPHTKEAKILVNADNYVATKEFMTTKKYKQKREDEYLKEIMNLF